MNVLQEIFYMIYVAAYDAFPVSLNTVAGYTFHGFLFVVWSSLIIGLFVLPVFALPWLFIRTMFRFATLNQGGKL